MPQPCVLCIDDNRATLASLAAIFQMHGHFAFLASNAHEAIQFASALQVDVVLLDCILGGEAAAKRITELQPSARILLHTGNPDFWTSPPFPVYGVVPKPTSPGELLKIISDVTARA